MKETTQQISKTQILKIKTQLSDVQPERKEIIQTDKDRTNLSIQNHTTCPLIHNLYNCQKCQKNRLTCPLPQQTRNSFKYHSFNQHQNAEHKIHYHSVNSKLQKHNCSVPKISFTYNQQAQANFVHRRAVSNDKIKREQNNYSFTLYQNPIKQITRDQQQIVMNERRRYSQVMIYPFQEVIYYPVIHNRLKLVEVATPQTKKGESRRKTGKSSYMYASRLKQKDKSTQDQKEPMTPQQFRKLTDWLLQQK